MPNTLKKYQVYLFVIVAIFSTQCISDFSDLDHPDVRPIAIFEKKITDQKLFWKTNHLYVILNDFMSLDPPSQFYRINLITGEKTKLFETESYATSIVMSEDERFVVLRQGRKLELHDLVEGTTRCLSDLNDTYDYIPFLIDGETSTLFYEKRYEYFTTDSVFRDYSKHKLNLETGENVLLYLDDYDYLIDFHPITKEILVSRYSGNYGREEFYTIDWNGEATSPNNSGMDPKFFMPDGSGIVGVGGGIYPKILIYDLVTNSFQNVSDRTEGFYQPSVSLNGKYMLCRSLGFDKVDKAGQLFIFEIGTQTYTQLTRSTNMQAMTGIGFFDNDRQVVFLGNQIERYDEEFFRDCCNTKVLSVPVPFPK